MNRKVSFENTKRLLDRSLKVNDIIEEAFMNGLHKTREDVIHEVNKAVYEMAEKNGMSIWDICFREQAAQDAMNGMLSAPQFWQNVWSYNPVNGKCNYSRQIALFAIACADELIKQLKEE